MNILHHEKVMSDYKGTEEGFEERPVDELKDKGEKEIHQFLDIVYRSSFSNAEITQEEKDYVYHFYEDVKAAYAKLAKGIHRLYFFWLD